MRESFIHCERKRSEFGVSFSTLPVSTLSAHGAPLAPYQRTPDLRTRLNGRMYPLTHLAERTNVRSLTCISIVMLLLTLFTVLIYNGRYGHQAKREPSQTERKRNHEYVCVFVFIFIKFDMPHVTQPLSHRYIVCVCNVLR